MGGSCVDKDQFGSMPDGTQVDRYTLRNAQGMVVKIITYGATVTEMHVPDRSGKCEDVVLGFDTLEGYLGKNPYFGCLVGRVAFRIAGASFELDGRTIQLEANNGPHHLHGGQKSFSRVVWQAEPVPGPEPAGRVSYTSPDGDQGYPGAVRVTALHTLTARNELRIDLAATTDRPTPINLTHHGYFNLSGAGRGDVLAHEVQIDADRYSVMGSGGVPKGELAAVEGTRLDFRRPTAINARPAEAGQQGYDLGYLRNGPAGWLTTVARVRDPRTGRVLEVATTEPAIIFYSGNALDGIPGKGGAVYDRHAGFCLEPGRLPDSVNHPNFPTTILRPGGTYCHTLVYRFSVE